MVAKEFYSDQEAGHEESTLLQDQYDDDDDDETLSLSDLPNSTISSQWGDFSKEDGKTSISIYNNDDDDNLFEFFSEEFNTSTTHDNIIFCGKLIPFKDHQQVPHHNQKQSTLVPKTKLNSKSLKSRDDVKGKKDQEVKDSLNVKSFACDYTTMGGKVSLVRCPTKSRWFLFLFGLSSNSRSSSKEMQLSDIRNRQSRWEPAMLFCAAPENGNEIVKRKKNGNCKGMWKLLKSMSFVLGCSSGKHYANEVVKAAFV
ncbi:hypothetical protein TSUD_41230 [Trifolium subterraneum]|nr:hypothetical protein TSUD_41230 [Trifolium subterraneum]